MTVLKVVTIAVLKDAIVDLIGRPLSHDLIQIAETSDNCIVRLLVHIQYNCNIVCVYVEYVHHTHTCTCTVLSQDIHQYCSMELG